MVNKLQIQAVGAIFYCTKTKRFLFLLRAGKKYANFWNFPGGKIEKHESVIDGLYREIEEEIGKRFWETYVEKEIPLEKFTSDDSKFLYHTFMLLTNSEFTPMLNTEHRGYAWVNADGWNGLKLHPGVFSTLKEDMIKKKIQSVIDSF